jgi:enoyl-CoA hydratase
MPDAIVERDRHTMVITMNRPKRYNALSGAMLVRMYDAYEEASKSEDVRCIIVTGAGGNFCSGADLKAMSGDGGNEDPEIDVQARLASDPDLVYKALFRHYRPTKPIIAAVEGVAIAGGTEILQAMEIRVAGESARFGVSEARWSLYPMGGSAVRLPRQIPYTHAAEILLTGKHIRAPEAKQIGLVGSRRSRARCTSATGWSSTRRCATNGTTARPCSGATTRRRGRSRSHRSAHPSSRGVETHARVAGGRRG